jgi:Tfp pilus assembly protein PilO
MKALLALPKDKLQKVILVAIVSLTVVGVAGYFCVGTPLATLTAKRREIAELAPKVHEAEESVKQEVKSGAARDQLKAFVEAQQARMVTGDPFSWVVRELSLLAEKHPVHVLAMRPGSAPGQVLNSRYASFVIHIEADGGYDQLGIFIRDLENSFPTATMRSLQLTPGDSVRSQCHAVMEFALSVLPHTETAKPATKSKEPSKKTL